jgi:hypothetical protein
MIQLTSKVIMLNLLWRRHEKWAVTFNFMTLFSIPLISMILKIFYFGLFEEYLLGFKYFMLENPKFYSVATYLVVLFGPNFARVFNSGLMGIPKSEFEKYSPFKSALTRMMAYTMILNMV